MSSLGSLAPAVTVQSRTLLFFVSRKIHCSFSFFALFEIFAIAFLTLYSDFSGIAKRFSFSCFQSIKLFYISWCRPYSIVSRFIHIRLRLILKIAQLPSNYFYHLVESHLLFFYVAMLFARERGSFYKRVRVTWGQLVQKRPFLGWLSMHLHFRRLTRQVWWNVGQSSISTVDCSVRAHTSWRTGADVLARRGCAFLDAGAFHHLEKRINSLLGHQ